MSKFIPVIGMEVHAELKTASKMFCRCPNGGGVETEPNVHVCPVCLAHPGALPVANQEAIRMVIRVGLALGADIAHISKFDRKNYFYPDLPKGYQISQYDQPLSSHGSLVVDGRPVAITRVHLEEDTGKLIHPADASHSLVDFNRAGVPLMELVTEPDITSATEAKKFCQELQILLRALGVSDADMEKGQMRCEANISLMPAGREHRPENFGTKVEVKNLNSFRSVERAITYEIARQQTALEAGEKVMQETRGWDDAKQQTYIQRSKESAHDYRYFPEPDLPPLVLGDLAEKPPGAVIIDVAAIRANLPELPQQRRSRFVVTFGLGAEDAALLSADNEAAAFTGTVFAALKHWLPTLDNAEGTEDEIWEREHRRVGKLVGGWITSELFKLMREGKTTWQSLKISPQQFADFVKLVYLNHVNSSAAQIILRDMFTSGADAETILEQKDLRQTNDHESLEAVIDGIINEHETVANDYRGGKLNALQYLVGQAMKATKGKANPATLRELFEKKLK